MNKLLKNNNHDKHCVERYGIHTCIFFQIEPNKYEIRMLDKIVRNQQTDTYVIQKDALCNMIPLLSQHTYTVIIVEKFDSIPEIVAVHLPVRT